MTSSMRNLALLSILIATAALWAGVVGIRMNSDDYQYLASLAPIQHFADVLRPFVSPDANASFFRPVANATMALDFLLFGWSGAAFHLTNLLFHLTATLLVFYVVRNVLYLTEKESLWCAFAFGIAASHEYNLVVDTARADTLAAIFVLLSLLLLKRSETKNSMLISIAAWVSFAFALLSKESAALALPLVPILFWKRSAPWKKSVWHIARITFPYAIVTVLFYFYRQHYTLPVEDSQPLTAAGAHSLAAFFRNGFYSIGYFFLPLDLSTATQLLTRGRGIVLVLMPIAAACVLWLVWRSSQGGRWRKLFPALFFTIITGAVLLLTFERWRLYLPSVGLIVVVAIFIRNTTSKFVRIAWLLVLVPLGIFQVYRALEAQSDWRASTVLLDRLKHNVSELLSDIPSRPLRIGFLAVPAKLGSASVLQLGTSALVERAEADRMNVYNRRTASTAGVLVDAWSAIDVYGLDRSEAFRQLEVVRTAPGIFLISAPLESNIILYPAALTSNIVARRDRAMAVGDSVVTREYVDIVRAVSEGLAKSIEVHVLDTAAALLSFNHENMFVPTH